MGCLAMIEASGPSLLDRIDAYLAKHRLKPTRFGKLAVGSPSLVARMREGKTLRLITIERIEALLAGPPMPLTRAQYKARRYRVKTQENIRIELAEQVRRATEPAEQAATLLRSRGWNVRRAFVHEQGAEGWCVGTVKVTEEQMLERARRAGWRG